MSKSLIMRRYRNTPNFDYTQVYVVVIVAVKKSRHENCFSFFSFSKVDTVPIFNQYVFSKVDIV